MVEASASAELRALAVRLRAAGEGAMMRQMAAGIRAAAKPLKTDVKEAALRELPNGGGLNEWIAKQKVTSSVLTGARSVGVRLYTRNRASKQADKGQVWHPTFGERARWSPTDVTPGYWTNTLQERTGPTVTPAILAVMRRVAVEIQGRGI